MSSLTAKRIREFVKSDQMREILTNQETRGDLAWSVEFVNNLAVARKVARAIDPSVLTTPVGPVGTRKLI